MKKKQAPNDAKNENCSDSERLRIEPKFSKGRKSGGCRPPKTFLKEISGRLAREGKRGGGSSKHRSYGARGAIRREFHPFSQRVVIKSRIIRTGGRNLRGVQEHLNYLQRDGAGLDKGPACAFGSDGEITREEVQDWAKEIVGDRHHFRMIVSPERGAELDLEQYTKAFMKDVEFDLNTKLDWLAVTHHNTDNPHVHIVVRGIDETGHNLVISRDYMSRGARISAEKIATRELGLRTERDIALEVKRSIVKDRLVPLDRVLERRCTPTPEGQMISLRDAPSSRFESIERSNLVGRLRHLEELDLATEKQPGLWRLEPDWTTKLKILGIRNDIIKTTHARIYGFKLDAEIVFFDEQKAQGSRLEGRVMDQGLDNELKGSKYILVEGEDKRAHYVTLPLNHKGETKIGDKVSISVQEKTLGIGKDVDRSLLVKNLSRDLGPDLDLGLGFGF